MHGIQKAVIKKLRETYPNLPIRPVRIREPSQRDVIRGGVTIGYGQGFFYSFIVPEDERISKNLVIQRAWLLLRDRIDEEFSIGYHHPKFLETYGSDITNERFVWMIDYFYNGGVDRDRREVV